MFRNYLTVALRTLWRNRMYSLINVLGLSVGVTCCLLIFLVVKHELSFDTQQSNADNIYRITRQVTYPNTVQYGGHTPYPMAEAVRTELPDLEKVGLSHHNGDSQVKVGETFYEEKNAFFAEKEYMEIFDHEWIHGNPETALDAPGKVVLSESVAKKYFGEASAMGQMIRFDNRLDLQVTGVIKDPKPQTSYPYSLYISMFSFKEYTPINDADDWGWTWEGTTFVVLPEEMSVQEVNDRLKLLIEKYSGSNEVKTVQFVLQPLTEIHFDERYAGDSPSYTTSKKSLWALAFIAILIIITACINFTNLATAQAIRRSREVGIRKVLGGSRNQLLIQFLGEALVLTTVSVLLAIVLAEISLPFLTELVDADLQGNVWTDPWVFVFLIGLIGIVTFMAGVYPAVIMSGFAPVSALKRKLLTRNKGELSVRRVLVVAQFTISQALIIGTLVLSAQMDYFQNKDLGFDKELVLNAFVPDPEKVNFNTFRERLVNEIPGIKKVSFSTGAPTSESVWSTTYFNNTKDPNAEFGTELKFTDDRYLETYGLELLAGEWLDNDRFKDTVVGYVVNEALIREQGFTSAAEALGHQIEVSINEGTEAPIVGVVKDFHNTSLHDEIRPCIMLNLAEYNYNMGLKIAPVDIDKTISAFEAIWTEYFPNNIFAYEFLDEQLAKNYSREADRFALFRIFAIIALLIGCIGVYGLMAFMAAQRTKEIGIRKVLGATSSDIMKLLSKDFALLAVIAFGIATPIAAYFLRDWLNSFAYRIDLSPLFFLVTFVIAMVITMGTIGFRAWQAARQNPADTIRTE